jgi:hypothetical protein
MGKRKEIRVEGLSEEQNKELQELAIEMEAEAIQMKADFEENPQEEMEGMVISVHQDSVLLNDETMTLDSDVVVEIKKKENEDE